MAYGKRRVGRKSTKRTYRRKRSQYRKRGIARANRAIRMVKALSKRVAGEVCKFESTPDMYSNTNITTPTGTSWSGTVQTPLTTIQSGIPWIMPLNWIYTAPIDSSLGSYPAAGRSVSISASSGSGISLNGEPIQVYPAGTTFSEKNPIWYNTAAEGANTPFTSNFNTIAKGTEYQYRMKYMYINALFNASVASSINNTDGALRVVLVKDKQPTGGAATWYDANETDVSRGVFNAQRIDAQLNPKTLGRFRIMMDKTLRFNTTNGYKPLKIYKRIASVIRNNGLLATSFNSNSSSVSGSPDNGWQTNEQSPPVQTNAYYLMIFSDGLTFTYTDDTTTGPAEFHLFNRIAYYNN